MRALIIWLAGLFGFRPDYSVPMRDWEDPELSGVGPNGMILLAPGRALTVAGGLEKLPTMVDEGPAGPNPFIGMALPTRETIENIPGRGFLPPPGHTTFKLWVEEGGPSHLLAENGYDTPVVYITHVTELEGDRHQTTPTVTAAVSARGAGVESRDHAVNAVWIMGMRSVPRDDICYDAATGRMRRLRRH